eukprot:1919480-Rhodomonas_salina.1
MQGSPTRWNLSSAFRYRKYAYFALVFLKCAYTARKHAYSNRNHAYAARKRVRCALKHAYVSLNRAYGLRKRAYSALKCAYGAGHVLDLRYPCPRRTH